MWYTTYTIRDNYLVPSHSPRFSFPPTLPFWIVRGGILVKTSHKLWTLRKGRAFDPNTVVKTLKLRGVAS